VTEIEQNQTEAPRAGPEEDDSRDPLKRKIAISLAAVVVLGAVLAVLQTDAGTHESNTARETTRVAVMAMRANVSEDTVLGVEAELLGERDFLPYRRPLSADAPSLTEAVGLPRDSAAIAQGLKAAERGLPLQRAQAALDRLHFETERATLRQAALATTRITWNTRATQYTTVIAVLAAALFLVGFGLVVEGRLRSYSYALGLAIAVVAAAWGAWIYHLKIPSTPEGAIDAAARASVRAQNRDFEGAISEYDRALALDDEYAVAYRGRAIARLLAANPDYQVTRAFTDANGRASAVAIEDAERALELEKGRDFLGLAVVGLEAFYTDDFQKAVDRTDAAIAINPGIPDVWFLRSAAEAALGDRKAAEASQRSAIDLLRGSEPSQRNRLLASAYLSYLEWVAWSVPERADLTTALSNQLVAIETAFTLGRRLPDTLPAGGTVQVRGLRYAAGRVTLRISYRNLPKRTALTGMAYERPLENGAWSQPVDLALFVNVGGDGERRISVPVVRKCKPTEMRVDVYLDGAPALSQTGPGVQATC
jgi:tetratricopeptide (TPR) repeat protein